MSWKWVLVVVLMFGTSSIAMAQERIEPAMEKMEITILGVSLTGDGTSVEIFSGEQTINTIGSDPGEVLGAIVQNVSVPAGTYTGVTVTVSRLMTMKMYLDINGFGRVMQTTADGIDMAFPEGPTANQTLDPNDYDEWQFLAPLEGAGTGDRMDPSEMETAPEGTTPTSAGSFTNSSPEGAVTIVVEDGKTTTFTMNFSDSRGDGFGQDGEGEFENPTADSSYDVEEPV